MIFTINKQKIDLNNKEAKQAKKVCVDFLKQIESISDKHGQKSFYFTSLIIMHVLTQQLLDEMNPETLSNYMRMVNELKVDSSNL